MKKITPLKSFSLLITLFCAVNFGFGQMNDLIISEYAEGSSNNKYIEIFNGTGGDVDLSDYEIWKVSNGGVWPEFTISLSGTLLNGDTYVIANGSASATILASANLTSGTVDWTGNDSVGLAKDDGSGTFLLIDAIGDSSDPGTGWDVAGTSNGTSEHTLVRKSIICNTNTNWATSAGTTVANSEWIVFAQDDWTDIGVHTTSCCINISTWTSGAWDNGVPVIGVNAVIADNFNTSTGGDEVSFSACNLTVNSGFTLTIADNDYVEVDNDVVVNGNITVRPYGAFVQNNDLGTVTYNGVIIVEKENAPADVWYEYTYWSSPVKDETIEFGLAETEASRIFMFDAEKYLDSDGNDIDDDGNDWKWVSSSTVMEQGVGYASTQSSIIFGFPSDQIIYTFEGPFNNGEINVPVYRNDDVVTDNNWNLIGNPYPSAIDAQLFLDANTLIEQDLTGTDYSGTAYTDGAIFLWSQKSNYSAANEGNQALNFSSSDYAIINGTGQTAGGDGLQPNRYIPSGQSFFISMSDSATPISTDGNNVSMGEVIFNNSMRVFGNISGVDTNSQFFKTSNSKKNTAAMANKLGVNLTSDNGVFNQTLIGYVNGASNDDDGSYFDARKNLSTGTSAILYSTIEGSDKKFAIQGKDINSINEDEIINLGFSTTIDVATIYTLSIAQIEGDFLSNNPVYLKDNLLNELHDLSASDYTFTSEVGEFNERFEIVFSSTALSTDEVTLNSKSLRIIELEDDRVQFTASDNLRIKSVNIFDLLGRQLYSFKGDNASETYRLYNLHSSIYIAKVALSNGVVVTKKAIKK